MRRLALLVGLVTASAMVSTACVEKIDTDPPGTGAGGGTGGSGGGTGGGATYEGLFGSGERLSAVYIDGGDGAERFSHFQDTTLEQACDFAELADGSVACLPTHTVTLAYADAGCSEPVLVLGACDAAPPAHVSVVVDEPCRLEHTTRRDAYTVGAVATLAEVYIDNGSGCVADTTFDDQTMTVHGLAAADQGVFAPATVSSVAIDNGLGRRVAASSDGAYRVLGAYNVARDEACSARAAGDATVCLSSHLATGLNHSTSASCATDDVAFASTDASCGEPQAVVKYSYPGDDLCQAPAITIHAVGDALDAADVYSDASGSCTAVGDSGMRYFEIGGQAAPGVLPELVWAEAGSGRLTLQRVASPDGALLGTAGTFYDTERDESCSASATGNGTRCLPPMMMVTDAGTGYFADDQCTEQVILHTPGTCSTAPPTYLGVLSAPVDSCAASSVDAVYGVGAEHAGPVYQLVGDACMEGTFEGADFFALGTAVSLDTFAPLEESTLGD